MSLFLDELGEDHPEHGIILQVDRASWHLSKEPRIPDNVFLLPQPVHSPELNPMEGVWDYVKENYFRNRLFGSMSDLIDYLSGTIGKLMEDKSTILGMINYPFIQKSYLNAI